jgi:hypothetical protein
LVLTVVASAAPVHKTFDAFAVWQSRVQLVPISASAAVVAGTASGALFIEGDYGPEDSGDVACPLTIEVDLQTGHQIGQGYCTFTAGSGDKAFGSWRCEGAVGDGCDGDFQLTGGTGRLANITGKSEISFIASRHDLHVTEQTTLADHADGITIWPELNVTLREALKVK